VALRPASRQNTTASIGVKPMHSLINGLPPLILCNYIAHYLRSRATFAGADVGRRSHRFTADRVGDSTKKNIAAEMQIVVAREIENAAAKPSGRTRSRIAMFTT
jgi:hypothetical protein